MQQHVLAFNVKLLQFLMKTLDVVMVKLKWPTILKALTIATIATIAITTAENEQNIALLEKPNKKSRIYASKILDSQITNNRHR